jgi:hypothetical protein
MEDNHKFGYSDSMNANDYKVGTFVKVRCISFLGRRDYQAYGGEKDRTGFYNVLDQGTTKELRFSQTNETIAKNQFAITEYKALEGKWLVFQVKKYIYGNGFVLTGVQVQETEDMAQKKEAARAAGKLM